VSVFRHEQIDAEMVRYRLEEAGKCLLSLPAGRVGPAKLSAQSYGFVSEIVEASGFVPRISVAVPDAATISRMDEALAWLSLIPNDKRHVRRVVAALSLVSPITERRVYSVDKIAKAIGANGDTVRSWNDEGIRLIVKALKALRDAAKAPGSTARPKAPKAVRTLPQAPDARVKAEVAWRAAIGGVS
jgi:hypothetical protein